ncbi:hypothetical protein [Parasphingorhabdus flavimaris]|uniref:hypothetical protein n=1 Tax=Parasphingorhabdus flavimaris TaxID=266812 RepID=UPI0030024536
MNIFADALLDLRYSQGNVSFRLQSTDHSSDGSIIHIPIGDIKEMIGLLTRELPKIEVVHANWISSQLSAASPENKELDSSSGSTLGAKIGSV